MVIAATSAVIPPDGITPREDTDAIQPNNKKASGRKAADRIGARSIAAAAVPPDADDGSTNNQGIDAMINNQGIDAMVLAGNVTAIPPNNASIDVANSNGARSIAAAKNAIPPDIKTNDGARVLAAINAAIPPDDNDNNQDMTIRVLHVPVSDCRSGVEIRNDDDHEPIQAEGTPKHRSTVWLGNGH